MFAKSDRRMSPLPHLDLREMTTDDWEDIIDLASKMWFDQEEIPTEEARKLAATIDTHLTLKGATDGIVVIDTDSDRLVGVIAFRGPTLPAKRVQGWHEVAIAKALARGDDIGGEVAIGLHSFEGEMRRYLDLFDMKRTRDYNGAILLLLLDPAYQGQGIGREMMQRTLEWFRSQGCSWVFLDTDDTLDFAFYEHFGWKRAVEFPSTFEIFGKVYTPVEYIYEYQVSP